MITPKVSFLPVINNDALEVIGYIPTHIYTGIRRLIYRRHKTIKNY